MDQQNVIEQFREALAQAGLSTSEPIIPDGKLHRFQVDGDKPGKKNGWYVLHIDERPAGKFGSWLTGQDETWTAKIGRKLTLVERQDLERKITEQKKAAEEERVRVQEEAARYAQKRWNESLPPNPNHSYLKRKLSLAHGIRQYNSRLVIPIRIDGVISSLQYIDVDGDKRFLTGGKIEGGYFVIAKAAPTPNDPVLICEGYSTGSTLHQATGYPVVCAFNAGKLLEVSRIIRTKFPKNLIVVCADNDRFKFIPRPAGEAPIPNPGLHYAREAANAIGALVTFPTFEDPYERDCTDFNDLHIKRGLEIVHKTVHECINAPQLVDEVPTPRQGEPETELELIPFDDSPPHPVEAIDPIQAVGRGPVVDWPYMNGKGKPLGNIENMRHLLEHHGISANYNVISKDLDISIPDESYLVDTQQNDKLTRIISLAATNSLPVTNVQDFVVYIAGQNPKNPVVDWISSKPWDGVSRLDEFYDTIKGNEDHDPIRKAFKETLIKRWMVSAVAVAFNPHPTSTAGVLVLQGVQGGGKTHWFKKLTPRELDISKDGLQLDLDNKDSIMEAVSYWLVELGEIDSTFKKSDISKLKAFVTKDIDKIRPPYAKTFNRYNRRTVFFGSVNDEAFLADPTGSRRFWVIKADSVNYAHGLDMQQVWAEILELYRKGEPYFLTPPELVMLNESNKDFEVVSPIEELIRVRYDWGSTRRRMMTATEIALEMGFQNPKQSDTRAVAKAIKDIAGENSIKYSGRKVFRVPDIKTYTPD